MSRYTQTVAVKGSQIIQAWRNILTEEFQNKWICIGKCEIIGKWNSIPLIQLHFINLWCSVFSSYFVRKYCKLPPRLTCFCGSVSSYISQHVFIQPLFSCVAEENNTDTVLVSSVYNGEFWHDMMECCCNLDSIQKPLRLTLFCFATGCRGHIGIREEFALDAECCVHVMAE